MQTLLSHHWHHLPQDEVATILETDPAQGLDLFEVEHRLERIGRNELTPPPKKSALLRFLLQFNNPLIYVLLASALITALVKGPAEALVILGVVLINAIVGYVQEARAEQAIEALAETMVAEATVLRARQRVQIPAPELVPGDMVILQAGDKVPADIRLTASRDMQIAEAALTGESVPVQKTTGVQIKPDAVLAERHNMAYASTLITTGQGQGIIVATGDDTEIGRISQLISSTTDLQTPLTRRVAEFSQLLLYAILVLAAITLSIGVLRGQSWVDSFLASVALAVASIPEGLPAALTVTLAIGVSRMARRHAIIRSLPAVEALGSATVVCSDKTGTLTQNQMTVQRILAGDDQANVAGTGYAPEGEITVQGKGTDLGEQGALYQTLRAGLLCNDSDLYQEADRWLVRGDPTEGALLVAAAKAGLDRQALDATWPRIDLIPFDSQARYMATLHRAQGGQAVVYLKGATEVILDRCGEALGADGQPIPVDADAVRAAGEAMAAAGLRVLAFAAKRLPDGAERLAVEDVADGLTFLGLQAMLDPPRAEAIQAVATCQRAGIAVKMITGDHASTAQAIAQQIGLCCLEDIETGEALIATGAQLAELNDSELVKQVERISVFARVSPEQKLRLVEALQHRDQVVAMTGDGVNDAPALKQADIGIAMGIAGTEVAKEAADVVLTDDNFATIAAAIEEGRGIFDNITKMIGWTLPTNLGEALIILAAILINVPIPIVPIQVLWINMVTVMSLGLVLAVEPVEEDVMSRPPRAANAPLLSKTLLRRVALVGVLILAGAFGLFEWEQLVGGQDIAYARTVAVNTVVMIELFYLFASRSFTRSILKIGLLSNPYALLGSAVMILLQLAFTYVPFMNTLFESAPVTGAAWLRIVVCGLVAYVIVEAEKRFTQRA